MKDIDKKVENTSEETSTQPVDQNTKQDQNDKTSQVQDKTGPEVPVVPSDTFFSKKEEVVKKPATVYENIWKELMKDGVPYRNDGRQ